MCLELMDLIGAMAKGDIPKIPVIVQTRGVFGRLCGDMTYGSMTSVAAVTLWGLIRTARLEMPKVPILTLDFQPTMSIAQITRRISCLERGFTMNCLFNPHMNLYMYGLSVVSGS